MLAFKRILKKWQKQQCEYINISPLKTDLNYVLGRSGGYLKIRRKSGTVGHLYLEIQKRNADKWVYRLEGKQCMEET